MNKRTTIERTRRWIASMVIGLNLCPFAQRVFKAGKIRYVATGAQDETALLEDLARELATLACVPSSRTETTLLIHPCVLGNFRDYNDFLGVAERLVRDIGLRGTIQIASFHPAYQFAGTGPEALENYTNRSPYPMLHLLREESISRVEADTDDLLDIPRRNIETLRRLGRDRILQKLRAIDAGYADGHSGR